MAYPNVLFGRYGDEKVTAASAIGGLPLGQIMILPDGRTFAHAQEGGTAGVVGSIYVEEASVAGHGNVAGSGLVVGAAAAIGSTTVTITVGATGAVTTDQYAGGFMVTTAGTVGMGQVYKIKSNAAAATTLNADFVLEPTDPINVALVASSSLVSLRTSPYKGLVLKPAGSVWTGQIAGVWPVVVAASAYGWIQRTGFTTVLNAATACSVGNPVTCSTTDAGAVCTLLAEATTLAQHVAIGFHVNAVDASKYGDVILNLPT